MPNELLIIATLLLTYCSLPLFEKLFGLHGIVALSVAFTVFANIEVTVLVDAFSINQTLGNVLFAATFLSTDIISECYGKKEATKAVNISIAVSVIFVLLSLIWVNYSPAENDFIYPSFKALFSSTPRIILSSLIVYVIIERLDVWLYHKIWDFTEKKCGNSRSYLWLRNNGATMISQLINSVLYTLAAFFGTYDAKILLSIMVSSFVIFFVSALLDTPVVYLTRIIHDKKQ